MSSISLTIEEWWPVLPVHTKSWLIEHNGEPLPPEVLSEITDAGGAAVPDPDGDGTAYMLTDEQIDWVEELANDDGMG